MTTPADRSSSFDFGADLEIGALANDQIVVAPSSATIREAAAVMNRESIGLLVLEDGDTVVGVVSERDVLRSVAEGLDLDTPAVDVGNRAAIKYSSTSATIGEVATEMMESYVRHVLLADEDGQPASIVSMRDLLAVLVD